MRHLSPATALATRLRRNFPWHRRNFAEGRDIPIRQKCYQMRLETWWDGDDAEPMVTVLQLTSHALKTMAEIINVFMCDMERFAVPSETPNARSLTGLMSG